jgi:hypothetical protein
MFDNEIDWVTFLKIPSVRREARDEGRKTSITLIQGRAHARVMQVITRLSVQVRRVSLGDSGTARVSE